MLPKLKNRKTSTGKPNFGHLFGNICERCDCHHDSELESLVVEDHVHNPVNIAYEGKATLQTTVIHGNQQPKQVLQEFEQVPNHQSWKKSPFGKHEESSLSDSVSRLQITVLMWWHESIWICRRDILRTQRWTKPLWQLLRTGRKPCPTLELGNTGLTVTCFNAFCYVP